MISAIFGKNDHYFSINAANKQVMIVTVFNPVEEAISLVKRARNKTFEDKMKLSTSDLIKFALIYKIQSFTHFM